MQKQINFALLLLLMITPCLVNAQKKELDQARNYIKSGKDLDKAEALMTNLLKDSAYRYDDRIHLMWFDVLRAQYAQANERLYLKQKQDTAAFYNLCSKLFTVGCKLDSIDMRPDKKGKVNLKYREKHALYLDPYRLNLFGGGTYHLRRGSYDRAFAFFEQYIDCVTQPLFQSRQYDSLDKRLPEAAYWATYSGYKMHNAILTLRYREIAKRDASKLNLTLQYIAEARKWLNDEELYVATLEEGFRKFPTSTYYFPRLFDSYTQQGRYKQALALCDSALVANDSNQVFLFAKSTMLLRLERYGESVKVSERLLAINDTLAEAYFNTGSAYLNIALKLDERKDKKQIKTLNMKARKYMERYRQLMPDEVKKWGPALYRIYLKLNMGKQFDEIDQLLKEIPSGD